MFELFNATKAALESSYNDPTFYDEWRKDPQNGMSFKGFIDELAADNEGKLPYTVLVYIFLIGIKTGKILGQRRKS